jgi:hypothetical protein
MFSASSRTLTDKSISQAESWAVLACCMIASMAAIVWSWHNAAMLNYGDAVAHLHIARRVFDSRTPRLSQLGSVWLPLPHILLIPFVQNYEWWATGLAGVIPSSLAYLGCCAGLYRLARRWLSPAAAAFALVFFALNPNLLYLQTTAMTEPLFLCEMIWIVVWTVEWRAALDEETEAVSYTLLSDSSTLPGSRRPTASVARHPLRIFEAPGPRRGAWLGNPFAPRAPRTNIVIMRSAGIQARIAAALVAAIFTRYDGWIIALLVFAAISLTLLKRAAAGERGRLSSPAFWLASLAVAVAPILWFIYNSVAFGDWLYFARGPYSAAAYDLQNTVPGWPPHPGWHNLWVALLFFLKTSQLDSIAAAARGNVVANLVLALAVVGTAAAFLARQRNERRALAWVLLLWLPVPFYTFSVAYGSVPIFLPVWWPHTWYNTRYGLELLPALAVGLGFAAQIAVGFLGRLPFARLVARLSILAFAILFALAGFNFYKLLRQDPVVYVESTKNLDARLPYDEAIPPLLEDMVTVFPRAPVLMDASAYPEIVSLTGIPLRQTINEGDLLIWRSALAAPAAHAAIVVAFDGDAVDRAVKANPAGLSVAGRFTAEGQPSATVYLSASWANRFSNRF